MTIGLSYKFYFCQFFKLIKYFILRGNFPGDLSWGNCTQGGIVLEPVCEPAAAFAAQTSIS